MSLRIIAGMNIRKFREQLHLSQADLGRLAELHRSYIGGVERGERNISLDNLGRISMALGIEAWRLLRQETYTDLE